MTSHYVTLLVAILGGLAVIGGAIWRVGSAVFSLMYEVRLGSWRLDRIERRLGVDEPPPAFLAAPAPRRPRPRPRRVPLIEPGAGGQAGGQQRPLRREAP